MVTISDKARANPPRNFKREAETNAIKLAARLYVQDRVKADEFDDAMVASFSPLFPALDLGGVDVKGGEVYRWDGTLVEVIQDHTTQPDWTPGEAASLYKLHRSTEAGPQPWVQPTGAHDAYDTGEEVVRDNRAYRSKIDANTTVPGSDDRWWEDIT